MVLPHTKFVTLLLCISVLKMNFVDSFGPSSIPVPSKQVSRFLPSGPAAATRSSIALRASAYDQDDNFLIDDESSVEDADSTPAEKKEMVSQIMVVAVGAFFAYSVVAVLLDSVSFVSDFVSGALDVGNVANFAGSVVGTVAGATWSGLKVAAPAVGKGVLSAGQAAAPYVQEASQKVSEVATPYVQEAAQKVSDVATPYVQEAAQKVSEAASPVVNQAAQAVTEAVDSTMTSAASTVDAKLVAPIRDVTDSVVTAVDSTVKATAGSVATAVDSSIREAAGSVTSKLQGAAGSAMDSIKQAAPF